jgi:hypothetical protein
VSAGHNLIARFPGLEGRRFGTLGIRCTPAIRVRNGGLFEADTGVPAICKLDTCLLKCSAQRINRPLLQFLAPLKPSDRVACDLRCCGKVSNAHAQSRSSHSTLDGQKNHDSIPISVEYDDSSMVLFTVQCSENRR